MQDYSDKNWMITLIFKNGDVEYSEQVGANDYSATERALNEINPHGGRVISKTFAAVVA